MRRASLAIVVAVGVLAGCGDAPQPSARSIAEDASAALEDYATLRFTMRSEDGGQRLSCDGAVDYERRRVHLSCDLGDEGDFEVLTIGRDEYARGSYLEPQAQGRARRWLKTSAPRETAADFPDLRDLLRDLRRAAVSTERLGRGQVRGVRTTRYRLVVDPAKMEPADAGGREKTATIDVWIDDHHLIRRLRGSEDAELVSEFFAFGAPVEIEPPPADDVRIGPG